MRWGYISLVKNGSEEVVIQELIGGSGGLNSLVMMKSPFEARPWAPYKIVLVL